MSKSYIRNLEQEVLRSEAALRHKKQENSNLELRIQQIDRKWELHNAKLNSKEKTWQDEFTCIQVCTYICSSKQIALYIQHAASLTKGILYVTDELRVSARNNAE